MNKERLYLIDAYALIFRAYYAFIKNPRFSSKGLNTSAILGFTNTMEEIIRTEKPEKLAVVFDPPGGSFRSEIFPAYKANRKETPPEIIQSVPYIKSLLTAMNIPVVEVQNYEADDVIGTLAKKAEQHGLEVYMVTPDKDYAQLLSPNIYMFKPRKSEKDIQKFNIDSIEQEYGVKDALQIIDLLALMGDSADNIPGAMGVGEVTAKKLIDEFETVENLYQNLDKLKPKMAEKLVQSRDNVLLSYKLATIVTDIDMEVSFDEYAMRPYNEEALRDLFIELEFRTLAQKLIDGPKKEIAVQQNLFGESMSETVVEKKEEIYETIKTRPHQYKIIQAEQVDELVAKLMQFSSICFDTETTDLDTIKAELVGISFSTESGTASYIPIPALREDAQKITNKLKPVFENEGIEKIGQNCKFDIQVLKNYQIEVKGPLFDTMIAHYLIDPDSRHNMDDMSVRYLNYKPVSIEELIGAKGSKQNNMRFVPVNVIAEYAGEDADITWQLGLIFKKMLEEQQLLELYKSIEAPLIYVLADMERTGVSIDKSALKEIADLLRNKLIGIETEIYKMAGTSFNIGSPKQLGEILFDHMKITPAPKKTKTNQYSTSEADLLKLKNAHPIFEFILQYRSFSKLLNTYVESLPLMENSRTGRIHTSFNQAVASTGRLSSTNPNLQNIPIKTEEGREIRKAFVPSAPNRVLLSADYSQIELRIMAHLSNDEAMLEAFREGTDIHTATAARINNVATTEVTREMRSQAKSANFGIIYGISSFGLAENLNISRTEAKNLIDNYFTSYPKVKEYMNNCIQTASQTQCVYTIMGRKRYLPDISTNNTMLKGIAERNAINAPIQGSAADIIKIAMIKIHQKLKNEYPNCQMILQVHDELVFDVPHDKVETIRAIITHEMENAVKLQVQLKVETGTGKNWLEAH